MATYVIPSDTHRPSEPTAALPAADLLHFTWSEIHQALGWSCVNARAGIRAALALTVPASGEGSGTRCIHLARARATAWLASDHGSDDTEMPEAQMVIDVLADR